MDFNIDEALENDADFSRGIEEYQKFIHTSLLNGEIAVS